MDTKSQVSDSTRRMQKVIYPLGKAEERRIIKTLLTYMTEQYRQMEVKSHFRLLTVELLINKPSKTESVPQRTVRVLVADYSGKRNIEFILDSGGKIMKVGEYHGLQPAFQDEEIQEARNLAKKDELVNRISRTQGLLVTGFAPESPSETGSRLVGLHYALVKRRIGLRMLARVIVDLSESRIVSVEEIEAETNPKEVGQ